ncbi:MAG: iron-containing alcohol dehydrogenase [Vicinamibacteria bacterium]|nr:iron-containing alcohol dehydrogenase [Vicinamibacteria bacterium]
MPFAFATATEIVFGAGARATVAQRARLAGSRVFVVTGQSSAPSADVIAALEGCGLPLQRWSVDGEPTIASARAAVDAARQHGADVVVACGGGSAIDLGKAVAALLANPGDPLDYVESIGRGQALTERSVPLIAVPTTAGTGAEVTRNAVLRVPEDGLKVSLRSPLMLPALAVIDPELTRALPPALTASTGMDALTQLIEPFVSVKANPLTDAICLEGLPRVARALPRAFRHGDDMDARTDMALGSLFGGLALANAALGAVHGFAAPIGGRFPAPHGAVCAALLPHVMNANVRALQARCGEADRLDRFVRVARLLTGDPHASAGDGVDWVARLRAQLQVPGLGAYGLTREHVDDLVSAASVASSMRGNPIALDATELRDVLLAAL